MRATIRVGIVAGDDRGLELVRCFGSLPRAELSIVCAPSPARLRTVGRKYPRAALTTDYAALLESDVEAVAIAGPAGTHYPLARLALRSGRHVLIEGPLITSIQQATELVALAERAGLTFVVEHAALYDPAVDQLRELVRAGELGRVWHVLATRFAPIQQHDASVLWDLAPQALAQLLPLIGANPREISTRGVSRLEIGRAEIAYLDLRFPQETMAHLHVSWLDPVEAQRLTVIGSRKMAVYDPLAPERLRVYDRAVVVTESAGAAPRLSYHEGDAVSLEVPPADTWQRLCAAFLEGIGRGDGTARARQALRIVRILAHADRSMERGGRPRVLASDRAAPPPQLAEPPTPPSFEDAARCAARPLLTSGGPSGPANWSGRSGQ